MPGAAAAALIGLTALSATRRRMAQRLATAVRHPLASAASTPPQLPLGDETLRHNSLASAATSDAPDSLGGQNPEAQFAGERGNIGRPSFPWGTNPLGTTRWRARHHRRRPSLPWGTKPRGQQQRQRPTFEGAAEKKSTENHGHSKDHGYKQDTAQTSRVRLKQKKNETTKMMPNHQG